MLVARPYGSIPYCCVILSLLSATLVQAQDSKLIASPVSVSPGQSWVGNDGSWATFAFRIGSPSQLVELLVSTSTGEVNAILPEACQGNPNYPPNCQDSRGPEYFYPNQSTTWQPNTPSDPNNPYFALNIARNLNLSGFGQYGFDTVSVGFLGSTNVTINHTIVAGMATPVYWNGLFGVSPNQVNFSTFNDPQKSYMALLKEENQIPSVSYGFTAGASYRNLGGGVPGSFIFGGYDSSRFDEATTISNNMTSNSDEPLTLVLNGVSTNGSMSRDTDLYSDLQGGIPMAINSAVSGIYLPVSICDKFASTFNLTYDNASQLYLVSESVHATLLAQNPSITLTFTGSQGNNTTKGHYDLEVPFAAFDLTASYPLIQPSSLYFPIHRASNVTQYTLGRVLLQETYLIVDYERSQFKLSQVNWDGGAENIIPILPTSDDSIAQKGSSQNGLGTGAIVGIVVGGALLAILLGETFFFIRRRKQKKKTATATAAATITAETSTVGEPTELMTEYFAPDSKPRFPWSPGLSEKPTTSELAADNGGSSSAARPEMDGTTAINDRSELDGVTSRVTSEMEGADVETSRFELVGDNEYLPSQGSEQARR